MGVASIHYTEARVGLRPVGRFSTSVSFVLEGMIVFAAVKILWRSGINALAAGLW